MASSKAVRPLPSSSHLSAFHSINFFSTEHLHLTPVSNLIHLRPQLHHIDAATQQERQSSAAAAASTKDGAPATASSARAIHMTIKTTSDGADGVSTETMADRLRAVQTEPWRKMRYTDENEETAWDVYNESLFLRPRADPTATTAGEQQQQQQAEAEQDLEELVPTLGNKWDDTQFLESISGIKKPEPVPEPPTEQKKKPEPVAAAGPAEQQREPPRATRPRAGAAAAMAARRGGRSSKTA